MNLLELSRLQRPIKERRSKVKLLEELEALVGDRLTIRGLFTALSQFPGIENVSYREGRIYFESGGKAFMLSFVPGTVVILGYPNQRFQVEPDRFAHLRLLITKMSGIKNVTYSSQGLYLQFDEAMFSPDLVAGVVAKVVQEVL